MLRIVALVFITQLALGAYYREVKGRYMQVEPNDLTAEEIRYVIRQFTDAAIRAEKAGFDGIQIHAAHFFFLSRFISPAVNHRTDEYGGSTENRARILLDIMNGIKEAAPKLHITIKINYGYFYSQFFCANNHFEFAKVQSTEQCF